MTPTAFAAALCARGIELTLRGKRLHVWPGRAYRHGLTNADRAYIAAHRVELKALVRAGLPETTVTWNPDADRGAEAPASAEAAEGVERDIAAATQHNQRDTALREHHPDLWLALHGNEPEVVAQRDREATEVMQRMVGRRAPLFIGVFE